MYQIGWLPDNEIRDTMVHCVAYKALLLPIEAAPGFRFFWHIVVLLHKFLIVAVKIFMNDYYFQAPVALFVTLGMIMVYSFARPFESTELDRLQTMLLSCECTTLILGILFNTVEGAGDQNGSIQTLFFFMFIITMLFILWYTVRDLRRFLSWGRMADIATEHKIEGLKPKEFSDTVMSTWLHNVHQNNDHESLELLSKVISAIKS